MSLTKKTITGILWNFSEMLSRRGIQVVITLLLAWFLLPEDFGLLAMMAVFLAAAMSLMDSGFKQALIRLQGAGQREFNTAFYANLVLGALSYTLLFIVAPFVALFYDEPCLTILIRVAGLNILINAFQLVQSAILSRELNFKAQLQAALPAGIFSGIVALGLAYGGLGVWALIAQMFLASLVTTLLLWRFQGWRPSLGFSLQSFRSMYNFGYKLFLSGLLEILFQNVYVVVIAKLFSTTIAGYYFFAYKLKELVISQLVGAIQTVTYPALATLQDDDIRLKAGFRKVVRITTFLLFPAVFLLAALAEPLFIAVLPEKWLPAVLYLQLMCLAGVMYPLHLINLNILRVKGRSDLYLYLEIIKKVMAVIILALSFRYGVIGILIGQVIGSVLAYIPNSYFSALLINYSMREQLSDFMPSMTLSGVVGLAVYSAGFELSWPALAKLLVFALTATLFYFAGAHLLKLKAYVLVRQMILERIKQNRKVCET